MSGVPPLGWWVDLATLLVLFYIGSRAWSVAAMIPGERTTLDRGRVALAGLLLWLLALAHALVHLGD